MSNKIDLSLSTSYKETLSRKAIFRGLWAFVWIWPAILYGIWVDIMAIVFILVLLFTGKRHKEAWFTMARMFKWINNWMYYMYWITDERPGFLPWEQEL